MESNDYVFLKTKSYFCRSLANDFFFIISIASITCLNKKQPKSVGCLSLILSKASFGLIVGFEISSISSSSSESVAILKLKINKKV
ncbi:hypothetical protein BpHYR1_011937 [Brachionus plicatilis]|uniref:Uncharacterized protein n=1 Tax=Brachionus plicatilis TaxID=10195 RepID=A0A3M7SMY6_BRAPC|nr:hypothetical protein BpHYR1_011937 [Brachionus plicatilis]